MVERRYQIGGVGFSLALPNAPFAAELSAAWAGFEHSGQPSSPPAFSVESRLRPLTGARPPGVRELPEIRPTAGGFEVQGPDYDAVFDRQARHLNVAQDAGRFPVETLVKMLIADTLFAEGGVLLHSVGLAHGERGAVFVGPSGAGKSTLGALGASEGLQRMADELVAVRPGVHGYRCYGTPWNVGEPCDVALGLLGRLVWAEAPRVGAASGAELLRLLLPNALLVDGSPEGRSRQFRNLSALVTAVPTVELAFARDGRVAGTLREALDDKKGFRWHPRPGV